MLTNQALKYPQVGLKKAAYQASEKQIWRIPWHEKEREM